jgi:hypothetical protein
MERYDAETQLGYMAALYVDYEVGEFTTRKAVTFYNGPMFGGSGSNPGLARGNNCHAFIYACGGTNFYCSTDNGPGSGNCTKIGEGTFPCELVINCSVYKPGMVGGFEFNLGNARTFMGNNPLVVGGVESQMAYAPDESGLVPIPYRPTKPCGGRGSTFRGRGYFIGGCSGTCKQRACTVQNPCSHGGKLFVLGNECKPENAACGQGWFSECNCVTTWNVPWTGDTPFAECNCE